MHDGLRMGRALYSSLTCQLPVVDGRFNEPRFGVVMRQQLRLGLDGLRKAGCQDLPNALMILLPGASEQRLIGCLLDEDVLEHVGSLGRCAMLLEELGLDELMQLALQGRLVKMRDGLEQLKAELPPKHGAQLRNAFGREESIEPGHERVLQRGGNCQWLQRTAQYIAALG